MWVGIHPRLPRYAHEAESVRFVAGACLLTDSPGRLPHPATLLYRNGSGLTIGRQTF